MSDQAKPKLGTCGACVWCNPHRTECWLTNRSKDCETIPDAFCRHYLPRDRSERCCETCEWFDKPVLLCRLSAVGGGVRVDGLYWCSEWQLRRMR